MQWRKKKRGGDVATSCREAPGKGKKKRTFSSYFERKGGYVIGAVHRGKTKKGNRRGKEGKKDKLVLIRLARVGGRVTSPQAKLGDSKIWDRGEGGGEKTRTFSTISTLGETGRIYPRLINCQTQGGERGKKGSGADHSASGRKKGKQKIMV